MSTIRRLSFLVLLALAIVAPPLRADFLVKDGQKVAFMGDSITAKGWESPGGFVHLVVTGLAVEGVKITPIPAGVGGNTSREMLARIDRDVLSKQPDWMTLSCGVNDVWAYNGVIGVDLPTYQKNITAILDQVQAKGVKVIIFTSTVIGEELPNGLNQRLIPYNDFLRQLAKERNLPLVDMNAAFQDAITAAKAPPQTLVLTIDGVHPNFDGHRLFARTILKTLGVPDADFPKVEQAWNVLPGGGGVESRLIFGGAAPITLAEYDLLNKAVASKGTTIYELSRKFYFDAVRQTLDAHAQDNPVDLNKLGPESTQRFVAQIKAYIGEQPAAAPAKPNP